MGEKRTKIKLLIGVHWGHDASICASQDGLIISHIEVERLSRKKDHNFKSNAEEFPKYMEYFLRKIGFNYSQISIVVMIKIHDMNNIPPQILNYFTGKDIYIMTIMIYMLR